MVGVVVVVASMSPDITARLPGAFVEDEVTFVEDAAGASFSCSIKCKNVWVWKITRFVMHILNDP